VHASIDRRPSPRAQQTSLTSLFKPADRIFQMGTLRCVATTFSSIAHGQPTLQVLQKVAAAFQFFFYSLNSVVNQRDLQACALLGQIDCPFSPHATHAFLSHPIEKLFCSNEASP
jgi:hypothetical protein